MKQEKANGDFIVALISVHIGVTESQLSLRNYLLLLELLEEEIDHLHLV